MTPGDIAETVRVLTMEYGRLCCDAGEAPNVELVRAGRDAIRELIRPPTVEEVATVGALMDAIKDNVTRRLQTEAAARN